MSSTVFLSPVEISKIVMNLSHNLNNILKEEENVSLVCVLKGALPFFMQMVSNIDRKSQGTTTQEFISISSYQKNQRTDSITIQGLDRIDLIGKSVIVFEDIIDSGNTIEFLLEELQLTGCKVDVHIFSLLSKIIEEELVVPITRLNVFFHVGKYISEDTGYLYGYGLDNDQKFRELSEIRKIS